MMFVAAALAVAAVSGGGLSASGQEKATAESPTATPTITNPPRTPVPTPPGTPPPSPGPTPTPDFTVNSTVDAIDAAPGDGTCASADGDCTLRAAIMETNALPGENRIAIPEGTYTLTIEGRDEDGSETGDLDITDGLTLAGAGPHETIIQACDPSGGFCSGLDRVFDIDPQSQGISVEVSGVAVQDGSGGLHGGGIRNHGHLALTRTIVAFNGASEGAGIWSEGQLSVSYSTVAGNIALGYGGGIRSDGITTIQGVMISANGSLDYTGAGIDVAGETTVKDSIVTDNAGSLLPLPGAAGVSAQGTTTVSGTTISSNRGGGIQWSGSMTLTDSTVADNGGKAAILIGQPQGKFRVSAPPPPDGLLERVTIRGNTSFPTVEVSFDATLSLNESTLADNVGGIINYGTLDVSSSTISANGAGIYNQGRLNLTNVTISGNTSLGQGAGVSNFKGAVTLLNSTITGNTAPSGGGIYTGAVPVAMENTIVEGNAGGDCLGDVNSGGHNIDSDGSCGLDGPGDMPSTDPMLGPLAGNGGPTQTHALLAGSPAINAGDASACPDTDQRGYGRAGLCDIGAYEFGGTPASIKQGDVNCDDEVNAVDALIILRSIADLPVSAGCIDLAGDVNCDGAYSAVDALLVLRYVADLPMNPGEPCPDIGTPL